MDRLLTRAGRIRNGGNASVIKDLRRNKNKSCGSVSIVSREKQSENNSADTKVRGEGGAGGTRGVGGKGIF